MIRQRYRGLLRSLKPRVTVTRARDTTLVAVWITVPDIDTGEPFRLRTAERIRRKDIVDDAVRRCFERALQHEVEEGLVLEGSGVGAH